MKCNGNRLWITGILLIGLLLGCVTDPASRKRGEASRNLGEAFMSQQNYTSALKELLAAEQLIPDDPYLHDDLGQTYMARERYDLAIDNFKKAIALKPDYAPAINNLGVAYMKQQNWDAAVASFNLITRNLLYATPQFPLNNLGLCYYHQQKYDMSVKCYLDALRIQPNYLPAILGLSQTYKEQGKISEAIALEEESVRTYPDLIELHNDLGALYTASKNYPKAVAAYTRLIELAPDSSPLVKEARKSLDALQPRMNGRISKSAND